MKTKIKNLETLINIKFKNISLLENSMIHKSFDKINNNEKLEFLGDRVLGLVIAKKLLEVYPDEKEGIIDKKFANRYYNKISLGIDFTARDLQNELKTMGLPWEKSKAFDGSALIGDWIDKNEFKNCNDLNFLLKKNGNDVQFGNTSNMLWSFDELISEISKFFTLKIGDVIFTGTPSGVNKVIENDVFEGFIENKNVFKINIK